MPTNAFFWKHVFWWIGSERAKNSRLSGNRPGSCESGGDLTAAIRQQHQQPPRDLEQHKDAAAGVGSKKVMEIFQNTVVLKRLSRRSLQGPGAAFFAAGSHASEDAVGQQYEELMERFQLRRLQHSHSAASVSSDRTKEELRLSSRSAKVHPVDDRVAASPRSGAAVNADKAFPPSANDTDRPPPPQPVIKLRGTVDRSHPAVSGDAANMKRIKKPMSPYATVATGRAAALLLTYLAHVVCYPVERAFFASGPHWFRIVELATLVVFLGDFVLAFNTSFPDKRGVLVTSRRAIARKYIRGWCVPDLIGALPVAYFMELDAHRAAWSCLLLDGIVSVQRLLHVVRVLRLLWTVRVSQSGKSIWAWLLYSRYSHLFRIVWIVLLIVLIAHYIACIWKMLEDMSGQVDAHTPIEQSAYKEPLAEEAETESDQQSRAASERELPDSRRKPRSIQLLVRGQAFGEIALLMNYQRTANARAVTYVEMCVLSRAAFQQILTRNPGDRKTALGSILGACMEANERQCRHCPLKQMVREVFHDTRHSCAELTARTAASVITLVVSPDGDVGKVTLGSGKNLKTELQRLLQPPRAPTIALNELSQATTHEIDRTDGSKLDDAASTSNAPLPGALLPSATPSHTTALGKLSTHLRSLTLADLAEAQRPQARSVQMPPKRTSLRVPFELRGGVTRQPSSVQPKRNSSISRSTRQLLHRMGSIVSFAATAGGPAGAAGLQPSPTCYADQLFQPREDQPGAPFRKPSGVGEECDGR
ncbi:hypothetical protein PybrP1_010179 [[Pythium] brassicae (nom. inval.)]|nr:hypothetical protein PybrP1_010179 [[Pythium] brassicae (nom. inval.)]